jgi:hypothetical protein
VRRSTVGGGGGLGRTAHSKLDPILGDLTHTQPAWDGSLNSNANDLLVVVV